MEIPLGGCLFGVTISWIRIYNTLANRWLNDNTHYTQLLVQFATVGMKLPLKCNKVRTCWRVDMLDEASP